MSGRPMTVLRVDGTEGRDVEVWLDSFGGPPADGVVIGVGTSRAAALLDAEAELQTALDAVQQQLVKEGVITQIGGVSMITQVDGVNAYGDQESQPAEVTERQDSAAEATTADESDAAEKQPDTTTTEPAADGAAQAPTADSEPPSE